MEKKRSKPNKVTYGHLNTYIVFWVLTLWTFIFVIAYRTIFQGFKFYNDWSFTYEDKPWAPSSVKVEPLLGLHYFGDFQLPISYLNLTNPYQLDLPLTLGIGPLAFAILDFLSKFGIQVGYLLFILLAVISLFSSFKSIFLGTKFSTAILIIVLSFSFSLPIFIVLDRGNTIILAASLVFYVYVVLNKIEISRFERIGVILAVSIAVSFKVYLLVTILLILLFNNRTRNIRILLYSLLFTVVANTLLSFFYNSNPIEVIRNIVAYSQFQSGKGQPDWLLGGVGPMRFFLNIIMHGCHDTNVNCTSNWQSYSNVPAVVYLVVVIVLIRSGKNLSNAQRITLALSTISNLPPVAMGYTLLWVPFALILLLHDWRITQNKINFTWLAILTVMNFPIPLTGILPWPIQDWRALETLLTFALLFIAIVTNRKSMFFRPFSKVLNK